VGLMRVPGRTQNGPAEPVSPRPKTTEWLVREEEWRILLACRPRSASTTSIHIPQPPMRPKGVAAPSKQGIEDTPSRS
jgi:hypothetical protein